MGKFIKGDIVVIPFPFSDLSQNKRRPALIMAKLKGDDVILCQITSKNVNDNYSINLKESDFLNGSLQIESNIRPNKIFTADENIILYKIGQLKPSKLEQVTDRIIKLFQL